MIKVMPGEALTRACSELLASSWGCGPSGRNGPYLVSARGDKTAPAGR
jgi:hypothetical protein